MSDKLQKFLFKDAAVRGELVEISETWKEIHSHQNYPAAVSKLLGEMVAASTLLSANIKFNGAIILQIHGDGPVRLLVVECDSELRIRATAKIVEGAEISDDASLKEMVHATGNGRFAITLDPHDKISGQQPYQGIVPLDGDSMATIIENYMIRSEQLDTKIWLAANDDVSRGLLLQKLPTDGGIGQETLSEEDELETWNRVVALGSTLQDKELLETEIDVLMHRLFWEETLQVFDPIVPVFACPCSPQKVADMLRMLGKEEIDATIEEQEVVSVQCDYCGQTYHFDDAACAALFDEDIEVPISAPTSNTLH